MQILIKFGSKVSAMKKLKVLCLLFALKTAFSAKYGQIDLKTDPVLGIIPTRELVKNKVSQSFFNAQMAKVKSNIQDLERRMKKQNVKHVKLMKRRASLIKVPLECQKIKCPYEEKPVCAKFFYKDGKRSPFYVTVINRCEMRYMKCRQGLEAKIVPGSNCHSLLDTFHNPEIVFSTPRGTRLRNSPKHQRRVKRDLNEDTPTTEINQNETTEPNQNNNDTINNIIILNVNENVTLTTIKPNSLEVNKPISQENNKRVSQEVISESTTVENTAINDIDSKQIESKENLPNFRQKQSNEDESYSRENPFNSSQKYSKGNQSNSKENPSNSKQKDSDEKTTENAKYTTIDDATSDILAKDTRNTISTASIIEIDTTPKNTESEEGNTYKPQIKRKRANALPKPRKRGLRVANKTLKTEKINPKHSQTKSQKNKVEKLKAYDDGATKSDEIENATFRTKEVKENINQKPVEISNYLNETDSKESKNKKAIQISSKNNSVGDSNLKSNATKKIVKLKNPAKKSKIVLKNAKATKLAARKGKKKIVRAGKEFLTKNTDKNNKMFTHDVFGKNKKGIDGAASYQGGALNGQDEYMEVSIEIDDADLENAFGGGDDDVIQTGDDSDRNTIPQRPDTNTANFNDDESGIEGEIIMDDDDFEFGNDNLNYDNQFVPGEDEYIEGEIEFDDKGVYQMDSDYNVNLNNDDGGKVESDIQGDLEFDENKSDETIEGHLDVKDSGDRDLENPDLPLADELPYDPNNPLVDEPEVYDPNARLNDEEYDFVPGANEIIALSEDDDDAHEQEVIDIDDDINDTNEHEHDSVHDLDIPDEHDSDHNLDVPNDAGKTKENLSKVHDSSEEFKKETVSKKINQPNSGENRANEKEMNAECPTECPGRDTMVCAMCSHGVYRTFLSVCHMRMYSCRGPHKGEQLELVSHLPCVMSAPFITSDPSMRPRGHYKVPGGDRDRVLLYVRCRERGLLGKSPKCNFDKTALNQEILNVTEAAPLEY